MLPLLTALTFASPPPAVPLVSIPAEPAATSSPWHPPQRQGHAKRAPLTGDDADRRKKEKRILVVSGGAMAALGLATAAVTLATTQGPTQDFDSYRRQEQRQAFGVAFGIPFIVGGGALVAVGAALPR